MSGRVGVIVPLYSGGPGMGPAGGQLGPAAPLQLGEEASDWLLLPGPVPSGGGGSGELLACDLLVEEKGGGLLLLKGFGVG